MRLIKLYSDLKSFKNIKFNRTGLSIIKGTKKETGKENTVNGVGKTLVFYFIDFCLGTSSIPTELKKINGNIFLDIEINECIYTIKRSCIDPNQHILFSNTDDTLINSTKNITLFLQSSIELKFMTDKVSFRTIISYFLRFYNDDFKEPTETISTKNIVSQSLNSLALLGYNIDFALKKEEIYKQHRELLKKKKEIQKSEFKNLFNYNNSINLEINILKGEIQNIEFNILNFKITDNLSTINEELKNNREKFKKIENKILVIKENITSINEALNEKIDIKNQDLIYLFNQIKLKFSEDIINNFKKLDTFNNNLLNNRFKSLKKDKIELSNQLKLLELEKKSYSNQINNYYTIISTYGNFEEYDKLNKLKEIKKEKLNKLDRYNLLLEEIRQEEIDIHSKFSSNNLNSLNYYINHKNNLLNISNEFQKIMKRLYNNSIASAIEFKESNNIVASYQTNVQVKVKQRAGSSGIEKIKINTFMHMILTSKILNINFLCLDDKAFYGVDSEQTAEFMKMINETSEFQYILALNENDITSINDFLEEKFLEEKVVVDLCGGSVENHLLGIELNLEIKK